MWNLACDALSLEAQVQLIAAERLNQPFRRKRYTEVTASRPAASQTTSPDPGPAGVQSRLFTLCRNETVRAESLQMVRV